MGQRLELSAPRRGDPDAYGGDEIAGRGVEVLLRLVVLLLVAVDGRGGDDGREPERDRDQDLDSRVPGAGGRVPLNGRRVLWFWIPPCHRDLLIARPAGKFAGQDTGPRRDGPYRPCREACSTRSGGQAARPAWPRLPAAAFASAATPLRRGEAPGTRKGPGASRGMPAPGPLMTPGPLTVGLHPAYATGSLSPRKRQAFSSERTSARSTPGATCGRGSDGARSPG